MHSACAGITIMAVMPLFRRIDPGVRELIAYIVARALDRGVTLNRTKLVSCST
jgi:hypothetical protein